MKYYSTNKISPAVNFKEATINGQAPDRGLYFPESIPSHSPGTIASFYSKSRTDLAFEVIRPYVGETIPENILYEIVNDTINFPIPLVRINDKVSSLELFHGPTMAFKDIGARFMSRCLGYYMQEEDQKVTVLVATSGDTGGAVADGFYGVEGVEVFILYPSGKVSPVQEKQLTTHGKNIHALEVDGSFDDCQRMVKQAFADKELKAKYFLTSANSINVARWLPQQFYYFFALQQWQDKTTDPVISVPSGNFGNLCAGILAWKSGLPIKHFVAACNSNNIVTRFLESGDWTVKDTVPTLSNAMDVGDPSNFIRILEIFAGEIPGLKSLVSSYSITDQETLECIQKVYREYNYLLEPHGAVGYISLMRYLAEKPDEKGIILETAHPVKFPDALKKLRINTDLPAQVKTLMDRKKSASYIPPDYNSLKDFLMQR